MTTFELSIVFEAAGAVGKIGSSLKTQTIICNYSFVKSAKRLKWFTGKLKNHTSPVSLILRFQNKVMSQKQYYTVLTSSLSRTAKILRLIKFLISGERISKSLSLKIT